MSAHPDKADYLRLLHAGFEFRRDTLQSWNWKRNATRLREEKRGAGRFRTFREALDDAALENRGL